MNVCSCCGRPLPNASVPFSVDLRTNTLKVGEAEVRVQPQAAEIAEAIACGHPFPVSRDTIGRFIYGHATRPVEWKESVRVRIAHLRKVLRKHGVGIECLYKRGYRVVKL